MPEVLGVQFEFVDLNGVLGLICDWRANGRREYAVLANPHSVMCARRDVVFRNAVAGAQLTLADGVGITLAARILGYGAPERIGGPTLMWRIFDRGREHQFRHFFFGGGPGVAERLAEKLVVAYPDAILVGTYCPPFGPLTADEDDQVVKYINGCAPDVVWVGLGTGKQEKWMAAHVGRVEAAAMLGVGAAFDFHSGRVPWAPEWMRRCGLEWAYRLAHEPRRLWRRNLDSPLFLAAVIAQRMRMALSGIAARPSS